MGLNQSATKTGKGIFRIFALSDVTNHGDNVAAAEMDVLNIHFDGEDGAVLTTVLSLDDDETCFAQPLVHVVADGVIEVDIDVVGCHGQHFLASVAEVETGFVVDVEELQVSGVEDFDGVVGTVHQFSEEARGILGELARGDVHADADQATGHALFDDDVDDLLQPDDSTIDGNHAVLELVIAVFLDGPRRKDQGALTILGMEVLDPESGILQPTFNGITEDVFDLLVDESGLESNRVCAAQDGANRFNELAVQSVQFARVALQARLGELLSQKGENREERVRR